MTEKRPEGISIVLLTSKIAVIMISTQLKIYLWYHRSTTQKEKTRNNINNVSNSVSALFPIFLYHFCCFRAWLTKSSQLIKKGLMGITRLLARWRGINFGVIIIEYSWVEDQWSKGIHLIQFLSGLLMIIRILYDMWYVEFITFCFQ